MALKLNLRTGHISIQQMLNTIKTQKQLKMEINIRCILITEVG